MFGAAVKCVKMRQFLFILFVLASVSVSALWAFYDPYVFESRKEEEKDVPENVIISKYMIIRIDKGLTLSLIT